MDETLRTVVTQLKEKTKQGKVHWLVGSTSNEYRLVLPESTISISVYLSSNQYYVDCKIVNNRGDIILRENTTQNSEDGAFLTNFFISVRDAYTGKEDVISSIMNHLANDDVLGTPEESDELPF